MNYSEIFKKAILNLYKDRVYTVDYAILKATDYADKGKLKAEDYEELMNYFIAEQEVQEKVEDTVLEEAIESPGEENTEEVVENSTEISADTAEQENTNT